MAQVLRGTKQNLGVLLCHVARASQASTEQPRAEQEVVIQPCRVEVLPTRIFTEQPLY